MKARHYSLDELAQFFQLGLKNQEQKNYTEAENYYRRILNQIPDHADTLHYLGLVKHAQKDNKTAIDLIQQAISINPKDVNMHFNLAAVFEDDRELEKASVAYQHVCTLQPNHALAHYHLGHVYKKLGNTKLFQQSINSAYQLAPKSPMIANSYAVCLIDKLKIGAAHQVLTQALAIKPGNEMLLANLGYCSYLIGDFDKARLCFEEVSHYSKEDVDQANLKVLHLNYDNRLSPEEIFSQHCQRAKQLNLYSISHQFHQRREDEKLRIGYVSADFNWHSVAYFFRPIIEHHDKNKFAIYCYSNSRRSDSVTAQIKKHCDHWWDIFTLSDEQVMQTIVSDQIDILVDLSGYTAGNRLAVFANRAAPIQVSYLGYPNTTGLDNMDYRITDCYTDPIRQTEHLHSEKLVRLDDIFLCYAPQPGSPPVSKPPFEKNDYITFGSFNNMAKINDEVVKLWSKLLTVVPNSKLILKSKALGDSYVNTFTYSRFAKYGINTEQLILQDYAADYHSHILSYHDIDIALDSFPYNGTATTCEALWMGVPVVTFCGNTHISRVSGAILTKIGLEDLIADSCDGYIKIAKNLALDKNRISQLRVTMRDRMKRSGFTDGKCFTESFESLCTDLTAKSKH